MKIAVPHHTTKDLARQHVERKLGELLGQFSHHAQDLEHSWTDDTLRFKGKARGLAIEGTVDVTASEVIIEAKLPLIAKPFESGIRQQVEREAEKMFRMA
jgi:hypothetical protein